MLASIGAVGCIDEGSRCTLVRTCEQCTMEACAWCFETGKCQDVAVVCPGEVAQRPEQCEAEFRMGDRSVEVMAAGPEMSTSSGD